MESTTPAGDSAEGQNVVAQEAASLVPVRERKTVKDRGRRLSVAVETPTGQEFASIVLFCQCCGSMVTGPQYRNHKRGDVVRLIGPHTVSVDSRQVLFSEGKTATIESIEKDGRYSLVAYVDALYKKTPLVVRLHVWPGETEEEPVKQKS